MISKLSNDMDIVLIVDDTTANHEVIQSFLSDIGAKCESAFDGMEAVTMCSSIDSDYYSLILMDINLPCMDGLETAKKIRSMGITSPIIAVTAASRDEEKLQSAEAEEVFDLLLFKPFNASVFYTTISPYVRQAILHSLKSDILPSKDEEVTALDHGVCDIHAAIENMGNSPRLFMKHFNNFKTNNADLGLRLTEMIENGQIKEAALLCHSIKGLSGMLGLSNLYKHVIELEELLRDSDDLDDDEKAYSAKISRFLSCINSDIRYICKTQF